MGDIDDGRTQALVEFFDFAAHLIAQLCIQVGQRLVKQEHLGLAHDGAANRHPLALPARQGCGLALQQVLDAQQACGIQHPALDLMLGSFAQAQPESHVVIEIFVRVQGVVLEHHGDVALAWWLIIDPPAVDQHMAAADALEAGNHAQQG